MPDVPNWAWHEYGNRVGFWRFIKVFDEFSIPGAICINESALATYPQIARAAVQRNWEFSTTVSHSGTCTRCQTAATFAKSARSSLRRLASRRVVGSVPVSPRLGKHTTY